MDNDKWIGNYLPLGGALGSVVNSIESLVVEAVDSGVEHPLK